MRFSAWGACKAIILTEAVRHPDPLAGHPDRPRPQASSPGVAADKRPVRGVGSRSGGSLLFWMTPGIAKLQDRRFWAVERSHSRPKRRHVSRHPTVRFWRSRARQPASMSYAPRSQRQPICNARGRPWRMSARSLCGSTLASSRCPPIVGQLPSRPLPWNEAWDVPSSSPRCSLLSFYWPRMTLLRALPSDRCDARCSAGKASLLRQRAGCASSVRRAFFTSPKRPATAREGHAPTGARVLSEA